MCKLAQSKMTEFKMATIIQFEWEWMSLNQIKLVWVRVRVEWEWFWVNLREDNKVSETKMAVAESNMTQYQDGCHHQVESEKMSEVFLCANGGNQSWQVWVSLRGKTKLAESKLAKIKMADSRWLPSSSWVRMNVWRVFVSMMAANHGRSVSLRGKTKRAEYKMS